MSIGASTVEFWSGYQPGFRFTDEHPGSREFFDAVEEHRYRLERHIPEMARFDEWAGCDVLDVGCGIATDGARFARARARYTGVDQSATALALARRRFELEGLDGAILQGSATSLPFSDEAFDLVWSHGVLHHIPDVHSAVKEFRRVLRPGGTAIVMVYNRNSLNYYVSIMAVRRALAPLLLLPRGIEVVRRLTREDRAVLDGHRQLLAEHGLGYLTDTQLFFSNNTDGPGNPLSRAYTRADARRLFISGGFDIVQTDVRYLNARLYPGGQRLEQTAFGRWLGTQIGWHLYVQARLRGKTTRLR